MMAAPRWRENTGRIPRSLDHKAARIRVRLRNGSEPKETWAAQTTRWTLTTGPASAFDVIAYLAEAE